MKKVTTWFSGLALLLIGANAFAEWGLNMSRGVTPLSEEMYDLHMLIFWVCVVISVLVFGAMLYSIVAFRRSKNPVPAKFSHSTTAEILWTAIPIVILVVMAIPAAKTLIKIDDYRNSDMKIKVTGLQWKWHYDYLDEGISFYSSLDRLSDAARQEGSGIDPKSVPHYLRNVDNPVVVPVNAKVRILLTSNDVLHAWWVPELGGKRDAIPGYTNEMWFQAQEEGVYRGQCAELCGRDHAFMPIVVKVVSESEYQNWLTEQRGGGSASVAGPATEAFIETVSVAEPVVMSFDELMAEGQTVYNKLCVACHLPNGQGAGIFPALVGSPVVTGDAAAHIDILLNGRSGTAMAAFGSQLSDSEIAAVVTFTRNAWEQNSGDVVQPADVLAAR